MSAGTGDGCTGGSDCTCGCCAGVGPSTPRRVWNRPGLDEVGHRTGTHAEFLDSMLAALTDAQRPALADLTTRDPGDPAIGLLDAWAVACDVLTFHTERQAQEAFLRTAVDRSSLVELGRLVNYRPRPGVSAETFLAFAAESPPEAPPLPAGTASQPGALPPVVPAEVEVPVGTRVQSIPGPDELPQTFETLESVDARPAWGAMPASTTEPGIGTTEAWLEGSSLGLAAGDLLVWLGGTEPVARVLLEVEADDATNRTKVSWSGSVGGLGSDPTPVRFHKRLAVFGHSAPQWSALSSEFHSAYTTTTPLPSDWPGLAVDLKGGAILPLDGSHPGIVAGSYVVTTSPWLLILSGGVIMGGASAAVNWAAGSAAEVAIGELELTEQPGGPAGLEFVVSPDAGAALPGGSVPGAAVPGAAVPGALLPGAIEAVGGGGSGTGGGSGGAGAGSAAAATVLTATGVWTVQQVTEGSAAEFALSGKVTRVTLQGTEDLGSPSRRDVVVHAESEELRVARRDDESVVSGGVVEVDADVSDLPEGRRILLTGTASGPGTGTGTGKVVHAATVQSVTAAPGRWVVSFDPPLPSGTSLERDTVVVHANVARAGHGESTTELLGSGRADLPHQRFPLRSSPLTHEQSSDPSGAEPALEVWVEEQRWDRVGTLYDAEATDRSWVLRTDPAGNDEVRFGDGSRGARLPTGRQNVRARYRTGIGTAGNVEAGRIANLLDRPPGLKGVENPGAAAGGADPEPVDDARDSVPLLTRTLDRAVSLTDYADFARTFAGVSKATASVLTLRAGPTVVVTVAFGRDGTDPPGDRLGDLADALVDHGDPNVELAVVEHEPREFRLAAGVRVDDSSDPAKVLADVRAAVAAAFAFRVRDFAQPVAASEVVSVMHSVTGVVAVDLDDLYVGTGSSGAAPGPEHRLPAPPATVVGGTAVGATVLVAAVDPFDTLEELS